MWIKWRKVGDDLSTILTGVSANLPCCNLQQYRYSLQGIILQHVSKKSANVGRLLPLNYHTSSNKAWVLRVKSFYSVIPKSKTKRNSWGSTDQRFCRNSYDFVEIVMSNNKKRNKKKICNVGKGTGFPYTKLLFSLYYIKLYLIFIW